MKQTSDNRPSRVIVVPRPLADHFQDRLRHVYADRPEVVVLIDRRLGERRRDVGDTPSHSAERRRADRRLGAAAWSLPELPVRSAGEPLAAGCSV